MAVSAAGASGAGSPRCRQGGFTWAVARRNSINTQGVVWVIIEYKLFMQKAISRTVDGIVQKIDDKTTQKFGQYVDIILVLLGISIFSVWGAFGRLGLTANNICIEQQGDTAAKFVCIMVFTGLTFGLYSSLRDRISSAASNTKTIFSVLLVMHSVTLFLIWDTYWYVIDFGSGNDQCDEFFGQQHMFLNVAFMGVVISAIYVYYALVESFAPSENSAMHMQWAKRLGHAILYAGIVALFFFYASSDGDDATDWPDDKHQLTMTLVFSLCTFAVYVLVHLYNDIKKGSVRSERTPIAQLWINKLFSVVPQNRGTTMVTMKHETFSTSVCVVVIAVNIVLASIVAHTDLEHLEDGVDNTQNANLTNPNNTATGCLTQHDDIMGMGITVIGYWTLYILILSIVFVQYLTQWVLTFNSEKKKVTDINWFWEHSYYYRDTIKGFQIPTVLVVITWVWLLAGGLLHHGELGDNCGSNEDLETWLFVSHTLGFVAVLWVIPRMHGSIYGTPEKYVQMTDQMNPRSSFQNRFNSSTNKRQVAVDVNTPLNFT